MTRKIGFEVDQIDPLELQCAPALRDRRLMSPFVWRDGGGALHILVRAVPGSSQDDSATGRIWHGVGQADGLRFRMDDTPLLTPGPGDEDARGCEDPTVVPTEEACIVYYTGFDENGHARMLYASGTTILAIKKRGVVFQSKKTQDNTKEAAVERTKDGEWRLFYEFSRDDASLIGLAVGGGPAGPWREYSEPIAPRPDKWDSWHLSTGPLMMDDPERPVMFYNGGTIDAHWRIGWAAFSDNCKKVIARSDEPLISPGDDAGLADRDIAFAASHIVEDGIIWLYYSIDDCALRRATVRLI